MVARWVNVERLAAEGEQVGMISAGSKAPNDIAQ